RRKIDVHPHPFEISCHFQAHLINEGFVLNRTESHLVRKRDGRVLHPHSQSPLAIKSHQQRYFRYALIAVNYLRMPYGTTLKQYNPTQLLTLQYAGHGVDVPLPEVGMGTGHKKLGYFFAGAQCTKYRIHPCVLRIDERYECATLLRLHPHHQRGDGYSRTEVSIFDHVYSF